ncbi:hypothetical protein NDU88_004661 [Pleurodeles waltl]|uniref:Uncharacterized protein n=1 Tax=Pleurodeles waltl TaxID=8319 RepID=A0AAV7W5L9_PLEWA|nr:hypothetical protein NDU88_004661 [Pleurodeles waltl]
MECEGDAGGERDANVKQDEEADAVLEKGDMGQESEEDSGGASHIGELHSSHIQDAETRHVPGGTWLAQHPVLRENESAYECESVPVFRWGWDRRLGPCAFWVLQSPLDLLLVASHAAGE